MPIISTITNGQLIVALIMIGSCRHEELRVNQLAVDNAFASLFSSHPCLTSSCFFRSQQFAYKFPHVNGHETYIMKARFLSIIAKTWLWKKMKKQSRS
jgi:hypothetical protein